MGVGVNWSPLLLATCPRRVQRNSNWVVHADSSFLSLLLIRQRLLAGGWFLWPLGVASAGRLEPFRLRSCGALIISPTSCAPSCTAASRKPMIGQIGLAGSNTVAN